MVRVWVFAELDRGNPTRTTLELLGCASELGEATAVILGPGSSVAAPTLGRRGAARALVSDDSCFSDCLAEPASEVLADLLQQEQPDLVLFGLTPDSRDVAGRVAARLGVEPVANATEISFEDGRAVAVVSPPGGAQAAVHTVSARPAVMVVRPKSFDPRETGSSISVSRIDPARIPESRRARITEREAADPPQVSLDEAQVVVSGGMGLGAPESVHLVEELATALEGAVGVSGAVVEAGWAPRSLQIGQTGRTVRPDVYIAAGISGSMLHTFGMRESRLIIAINKDPQAPVFQIAHLGVVGDLHEILPALTAAARAYKRELS